MTTRELSAQSLALMFEPVIYRTVILAGGGGGIADAIAQWRGDDGLEEANRIIEQLALRLAEKAIARLRSPQIESAA